MHMLFASQPQLLHGLVVGIACAGTEWLTLRCWLVMLWYHVGMNSVTFRHTWLPCVNLTQLPGLQLLLCRLLQFQGFFPATWRSSSNLAAGHTWRPLVP